MGICETEQMIENFSKQYYEKIFYFSLKKTSNRSEAEDLTSDIALDVIAALRKGIIPEHFSAYVWKAARNRYSKWTAKKSRSKESLTGEDFYNSEYADYFDIEKEYIKKEEINTLRREISLVSKEYREIMLSFYIDDKKVSQISKELGLPEGTVKTKLFKIRKKLMEGMNMAREFGIKSYKPENINLVKSGKDGYDGSPWMQVGRKLAKNILLEAYHNPSTIEELSLELGVAAPYMEDEVEVLEAVELIHKTKDNKYETNFMILSAEAQRSFIAKHRAIKEEYFKTACEIIDIIGKEAEKSGKKLLGGYQTFEELKWLLIVRLTDEIQTKLILTKTPREKRGYSIRPRDGKWDMVGFEDCNESDIDIVEDSVSTSQDGWEYGDKKIWTYTFSSEDWKSRNRSYSQEQVHAIYQMTEGKIDGIKENIIEFLLSVGLFEKDGGKYIPKFAVAQTEKSVIEQSVSKDIYKEKIMLLEQKMYNMLEEVYNFVEAGVKKEIPERLFDKTWMVTETNVGMRGYMIASGKKSSWLKLPENAKANAVGTYILK